MQMVQLLRYYRINLHSNMVLLKSCLVPMIIYIYHIYIPIWFYLNEECDEMAGVEQNLHSNMVLLKSCSASMKCSRTTYLHSNMVLLKFKTVAQTAVAVIFTFQYGST